MSKVIALDCESNGLHGQIFCVAAVLFQDGTETASFVGRCPITGPVDEWVAQNVLPQLVDIPVTCSSYAEMCAAYDNWYQAHKDGAVTVAHIAWPVEARFLLDCHAPFSGPYPLIDTSSLLLAAGEDPLSEIAYAKKHGMPLPEGSEHDPRFDARLTAAVYMNLA
jgi:hypothetical protein